MLDSRPSTAPLPPAADPLRMPPALGATVTGLLLRIALVAAAALLWLLPGLPYS